MDVNKAKKVLAEGMFVGYNPGWFILGVQHGDSISAYMIDPAGAKAFAENLTNRVAEYELKIGPIDTSGLKPLTVSPLQPK